MFYVVPVATTVKTIVYMGLRAMIGRSIGSSRNYLQLRMQLTIFIVASLHHRSGSILVFGWTVTYKWGHLVAAFTSDGGDYTSLPLNDTLGYTRGPRSTDCCTNNGSNIASFGGKLAHSSAAGWGSRELWTVETVLGAKSTASEMLYAPTVRTARYHVSASCLPSSAIPK
eukprot:6211494-Pleurochrysis_carterae.AAC.4